MTTRTMYGEPDTPKEEHKFSSTQVNITGRAAQMMQKLAMQIPDSDLAEDGREHEQHITTKYGLHFQTPSQRLRNALVHFGPVTATLGKTSLFHGDDADVLKIDVESPDLHRLNKLISRLTPTHDTFPTYKPHATIAYLVKGKGRKYTGNTALAGTTLTFDSVLFSGKRGHKELIRLTGAGSALTYRAK
jgi:2'-5' RNA ligase